MDVNDALNLGQDLADRASKEVELRILERQFGRDVGRHPELPAPALIAALDQYLARERAEARVYDQLVQHLAGVSWDALVAAGVVDEAVAARCGVCVVVGSTQHTG